MSANYKNTLFEKILSTAPLLLLYISVFNDFDFNYKNINFFSFNFPFILIYYWSSLFMTKPVALITGASREAKA